MRRRTAGQRVLLLCLALTMTTAGSCDSKICSVAFPADMRAWLADDWPEADHLVLTIACPDAAECGFLDGPVTGVASETVTARTLLRPPRVEVRVVDQATGGVILEQVNDVEYTPSGRQSECGGDALAAIVVTRP